MAKRVTATKANLIKVKNALDFARRGYSLLDKKRAVLMREIMRLNARAQTIQQEVEKHFSQSYDALTMASVTMGWESVVGMSKSMPTEEPYHIGYRSVMGWKFPKSTTRPLSPKPPLVCLNPTSPSTKPTFVCTTCGRGFTNWRKSKRTCTAWPRKLKRP